MTDAAVIEATSLDLTFQTNDDPVAPLRFALTHCAAALAGLLAVSSGQASAQQAWGDEGGCARVLTGNAGTDLVFVLWPDRIERHESTCRIVDVQGDLSTRAVIETACEGEGESWRQDYGLSPVGTDAYAVWPADAPEYVFTLKRCEE